MTGPEMAERLGELLWGNNWPAASEFVVRYPDACRHAACSGYYALHFLAHLFNYEKNMPRLLYEDIFQASPSKVQEQWGFWCWWCWGGWYPPLYMTVFNNKLDLVQT